jgi:hypothetical protein
METKQWTQSIQRAFDVACETYDIWDVDIEVSGNGMYSFVGNTENIERIESFIFNSRLK